MKLYLHTNRDEELPLYNENSELEDRVAKLEDILAVNKKVQPMPNNSAVSLGNCSKGLFKPEEDNTRSQNALEEVPFDNPFDSISKPQRESVIISNTQKSLTKRYLSNSQIVKGRILKTLEREKRCCCAFCKLFGNEITTNNQMYTLVKGHSFLVLPVMRISIIFFAILLEFALNALFYSLNPS